jgi:hypothetical protein
VPFTASHAAAVLPFVGARRLLPAGLVIGSMAPDLFYFLPFDVPREFAHSLVGALTIDLPLGVVVFALWQYVFRRPVVDFAPVWVRERLAGLPAWRDRGIRMSWPASLGSLVVSLLLGAATHIVWDTLTHNSWLTEGLPAVRVVLGPQMLFEWLQDASSVAGLLVLALWGAAWLRRTPRVGPVPTRLVALVRVLAWVSVGVAGAVVALAIWRTGIERGYAPFESALTFLAVRRGIAVALLLAMLWSLVWWTVPRRR